MYELIGMPANQIKLVFTTELNISLVSAFAEIITGIILLIKFRLLSSLYLVIISFFKNRIDKKDYNMI